MSLSSSQDLCAVPYVSHSGNLDEHAWHDRVRDGNADRNADYETRNSPAESEPSFDFRVSDFDRSTQQYTESAAPTDLGPNHERLEDVKPELVHALRELVRQYP